ncbi:hypothetical protein [Nostoc sp. NZL]|uniref:hypothetical protein n=1 Tax=Nostoc sp. NZL TaxID=2650612 RepID=UPI0018C69399|nr:hypothetical protein [Nostoc sp. NZL]MBG1240540.1 hypothetical protein [Nostoc sp. NZL]
MRRRQSLTEGIYSLLLGMRGTNQNSCKLAQKGSSDFSRYLETFLRQRARLEVFSLPDAGRGLDFSWTFPDDLNCQKGSADRY